MDVIKNASSSLLILIVETCVLDFCVLINLIKEQEIKRFVSMLTFFLVKKILLLDIYKILLLDIDKIQE